MFASPVLGRESVKNISYKGPNMPQAGPAKTVYKTDIKTNTTQITITHTDKITETKVLDYNLTQQIHFMGNKC
jgi:hypothetical protein